MTPEQKYELAIEFIEDTLDKCVACHNNIYDPAPICDNFRTNGDTQCRDCWKAFIECGRWWEREYEPDPDRKWKEMHGE